MARAAGGSKERLAASLARVIELRRQLHVDAEVTERWHAVKRFQAERLRRSYPDLLASPRYRPACEFFLEELYGDRDFEQRDQEALRIVPKLALMLPERAVETIALAVELDEMSEVLDVDLARALKLPIDVDEYAAAYRATGTIEERARQIETVDRIGRALEKLARFPLLSAMLHMMRAPAYAAGLGHLQRFLETGFDAFVSMGAAAEFLRVIRERETVLMKALFEGRAELLHEPERLAESATVR